MDVDIIKASQEDHMDMMAAIMQMEKLSEFCEPFNNTSTLPPEIQFSNGNISTNVTIQPIFHNPNSPSTFGIASCSMPFISTQSNVTGRYKSSFALPNANPYQPTLEKRNSMATVREMIFRIAAMQPIHIDPESIKPPKRRNVKISKDPQSVAARHRRERISQRIRILQRLVPGGTKMDTASMLDEAIHYVKFLKKQVQTLEQAGAHRPMTGVGFSGAGLANVGSPSLVKACYQPSQMVDNMPKWKN